MNEIVTQNVSLGKADRFYCGKTIKNPPVGAYELRRPPGYGKNIYRLKGSGHSFSEHKVHYLLLNISYQIYQLLIIIILI